MKFVHRKDGRYEVRIPRKVSVSGKRESKYFHTKQEAEDFIRQLQAEQREHGRQAVTATERRWLGYLRERIGDLSLLPEIVNFWKRSGEHLQPIATKDAVRSYITFCDAEYSNRRTLADISFRLQGFADHFGNRPLHEITVTDVETFLATFKYGWNRWGYDKRLRPFYKVAKRRRWVSANPLEDLPKPRTPTPERQLYSAEEFERLLRTAQADLQPLLPYLILAGYCFLRHSELVRKYQSEQVLQWSDILWTEKPPQIHVRPGVAKTTRRQTNERFIPLSSTAQRWLAQFRKETGDCVTVHGGFINMWKQLTDAAKVPRVKNALRHSSISYSIAANPASGVELTARWAGNSEATIRLHYLKLLKPAEAEKWFQILPVLGPRAAAKAAAKAEAERHPWAQEMAQMQAVIRRQPIEAEDLEESPSAPH
jgi:site-specific recombinase XerD